MLLAFIFCHYNKIKPMTNKKKIENLIKHKNIIYDQKIIKVV